MICPSQTGFRKTFSTIDNRFILKFLVDIFHYQKKRFYSCLVDFKQASDTVWRTDLRKKMVDSDTNSISFTFYFNMYSNIKSQVKTNKGSSGFFKSYVVARQVKNLSSVLYSIFLNDLENLLVSRNTKWSKT